MEVLQQRINTFVKGHTKNRADVPRMNSIRATIGRLVVAQVELTLNPPITDRSHARALTLFRTYMRSQICGRFDTVSIAAADAIAEVLTRQVCLHFMSICIGAVCFSDSISC